MQLGSLLHWWYFAVGWALFLSVSAQVNITVDDTAPEIVYSPPACNATIGPEPVVLCNSSWQIVSQPDAFNGTVTSTIGPTAGGGDLIPQLFLTFQGIALYIRTSLFSTAIANVTLSTENPVVSITTQVNTSTGFISAVGLPADKATTLAITYIVTEGKAARLDIDSITITTATNNTSPFALVPLPPSTTLSSFSFASISPSAVHIATRTQTRGDIAAEVLGAVLGVVLGALGVAAIRYYRRRRSAPLNEQSSRRDDTFTN